MIKRKKAVQIESTQDLNNKLSLIIDSIIINQFANLIILIVH